MHKPVVSLALAVELHVSRSGGAVLCVCKYNSTAIQLLACGDGSQHVQRVIGHATESTSQRGTCIPYAGSKPECARLTSAEVAARA